MSGDVQPRKRGKDKSKRRRAEDADAKAEQLARKMSTHNNDGEDEDVKGPQVSGVPTAKMGPDDIQLHVHSDHGTGGHWCAKIFFFSLMAILVGLVGLILLENRGISDLDTPLSESRFADYLDGWVEEKRESHDEHDILESLHELDDHEHDDEPFSEEEDHDEENGDHDDDGHDDHDDDEHDDDDDHDDEDNGDDQEESDEAEADADEEDGATDDADDDDQSAEVDNSAGNDDDDNDEEENDAGGDDENVTASEEEEVSDEQATGEEADDDDEDNSKNDDDDDEDDKTTTESNEADDNEDRDNDSNDEDTIEPSEEDNSQADDDDDIDPFEESITASESSHLAVEKVNAKNASSDSLVSSDALTKQVDELYERFNKLAATFDVEPVIDRPARSVNEDDDDDDVSLEEVIDNDEGEDLHLQKLANKDESAGDEDDAEPADESSSLTVKIGVGLALVVVAYLVLAKKAQSQENQKPSGHAYNAALEEELRRANQLLEDNPESALNRFDEILSRTANRTAALYGRAKALDVLAAQKRNNQLLRAAIDGYRLLVVEFGSHLPDDAFLEVANRCVEQMRFIGQNLNAVPVHEAMMSRFVDDPEHRNQLAVTYLMANQLDEAKFVLHETLLQWPSDGFALVHYGFVLKNLDNDLVGAVRFLRDGILTGAKGTSDGRFFFALGDSLQRLGRVVEARRIYRVAVARRLFLSEYQRSLYNVDRLQSRPFWTKEDTSVVVQQQLDVLEQNWERIRDEGLSVLGTDGYFTDESENLRERGQWKQFNLFTRGRKDAKHCELTPFTCKLIDEFSAARTCTRGQVKFSVMHPGTHVWPHCGPTNCRIRAHLGLQVPPKTFIRVANETRTWNEGSVLIFDDSFEHEVWHNGTDVRLVLIVDFWHPDLSAHERKTLPPI